MIFVALNSNSRTPLRQQIYQKLRAGIQAGRLRPGDRLPSSRDFAGRHAIARSTAVEAYEQLIAEGYLETARGSGTFVCRRLPDRFPTKPAAEMDAKPVQLSRFGEALEGLDVRRTLAPPGVIHFKPGIPDVSEFPFRIWSRLLMHQLRSAKASAFDYAEDPAGDLSLREQIARYAARTRGVRCSADQVIVVNGSQQALDLSVRVLLDHGDSAAVENPGYPAAHRIFRAHGARLFPMSLDKEGAVPDRLPSKVKVIYVTPSHQYPTGISMSVARRIELLRIASEQGAVVLEDDYSSEFRYSGPPLPSLQGLNRDAAVIYMGTFSKAMFPALRIGFLVVPHALMESFRCAKWLADRQAPAMEQLTLGMFLREGHLDRHIRRMRRIYGQRREVLLDALRRSFGDGAQVLGDAAGMHALVRFAGMGVAQPAARNGVWLQSADPCYLEDSPGGEFLIGFASLRERAIREGIRRIVPV